MSVARRLPIEIDIEASVLNYYQLTSVNPGETILQVGSTAPIFNSHIFIKVYVGAVSRLSLTFLAAAIQNVQFFDENGNFLGTTESTSPTVPLTAFAPVSTDPNSYLILALNFNTTVILPSTPFLRLASLYTPRLHDFFEDEVEISETLPSTIIPTIQSSDQKIIFKFTNHQTSQGLGLILAFAYNAKTNGTFTIISSDNSVYPSYTQPFQPFSNIIYNAIPQKNTVFNGTITLGVIGVGIEQAIGQMPTPPIHFGNLRERSSSDSLMSVMRNKYYKKHKVDDKNIIIGSENQLAIENNPSSTSYFKRSKNAN